MNNRKITSTTYFAPASQGPSLGGIFENHPSDAVDWLDGSGPENCCYRARKLFFSKLTGNNLFRTRLMCRDWCSEIDQYLTQIESVKFFGSHKDLQEYTRQIEQMYRHSMDESFKASTNSLKDLELIYDNLGKLIMGDLLKLIPNVTKVMLLDDFQPNQGTTSNSCTYRGYAKMLLSELPKVDSMVLFCPAQKHENNNIEQQTPNYQDPPFSNLLYAAFFHSDLKMFFLNDRRRTALDQHSF